MSEDTKKLQPILKHKSNLKDKQVNISGNNDFGSISDALNNRDDSVTKPAKKNNQLIALNGLAMKLLKS